MRIEYQHNLEIDEAYQKIDTFLDRLQEEYNNEVNVHQKSWNFAHDKMDFNLEFSGFEFKGQICLGNKKVILELRLPLLARMFSSKIEELIRNQLDEFLS